MPVTDYYLTTDAMGSVTAVLDEYGNVLERRSYDAFGEMTCMTPDGTPVAESPTGLDVGFQGQIRDDATDLYQMGYRWYNPVLGRWLSRDPIGLEGSWDFYCFAENGPNIRIDYFGLEAKVTLSNGDVKVAQDTGELIKVIEATKCGEIVAIRIWGHADPNSLTLSTTDRSCRDAIRKVASSVDKNGAMKGPGSQPSCNVLMVGPSTVPLSMNNVRGDAIVRDSSRNAIGYDFKKIINDKLAPDAVITLKGCCAGKCYAATDGTSIAREISKCVPSATVNALRVEYFQLLFNYGFPLFYQAPRGVRCEVSFKGGSEVK